MHRASLKWRLGWAPGFADESPGWAKETQGLVKSSGRCTSFVDCGELPHMVVPCLDTHNDHEWFTTKALD